MADKTAL